MQALERCVWVWVVALLATTCWCKWHACQHASAGAAAGLPGRQVELPAAHWRCAVLRQLATPFISRLHPPRPVNGCLVLCCCWVEAHQ